MKRSVARTLEEIAKAVDGEISFHNGSSKIVIDSIAASPDCSTERDIVFVYEQKYFKDLEKIKAKVLILPLDLRETLHARSLPQLQTPVIWVKRPRLVLKKLLELFKSNVDSPGIHQTAFIHPSSTVDKSCAISPFVYIGPNVSIGKNCRIGPNCSIMHDVVIGNNVILHAGVVIGADGYSYVTSEESNLEKAKKGNFNFNLDRQIQHKIPSIGTVIIEDDVEIGANSCIDRGTIGETVIGAGTKIDNLVQIAHNCKIGKDCLIVGQVGFAGSVKLGDRVVVGGQCGFADNISIGSDVIFVARAAIHGDISSNSVYMGIPAVPYQEYFKNEKTMKRLPRKQEKLEEQIKSLEEKIKQLEERLRIKV